MSKYLDLKHKSDPEIAFQLGYVTALTTQMAANELVMEVWKEQAGLVWDVIIHDTDNEEIQKRLRQFYGRRE